jgi:hypothetical protein
MKIWKKIVFVFCFSILRKFLSHIHVHFTESRKCRISLGMPVSAAYFQKNEKPLQEDNDDKKNKFITCCQKGIPVLIKNFRFCKNEYYLVSFSPSSNSSSGASSTHTFYISQPWCQEETGHCNRHCNMTLSDFVLQHVQEMPDCRIKINFQGNYELESIFHSKRYSSFLEKNEGYLIVDELRYFLKKSIRPSSSAKIYCQGSLTHELDLFESKDIRPYFNVFYKARCALETQETVFLFSDWGKKIFLDFPIAMKQDFFDAIESSSRKPKPAAVSHGKVADVTDITKELHDEKKCTDERSSIAKKAVEKTADHVISNASTKEMEQPVSVFRSAETEEQEEQEQEQNNLRELAKELETLENKRKEQIENIRSLKRKRGRALSSYKKLSSHLRLVRKMLRDI